MHRPSRLTAPVRLGIDVKVRPKTSVVHIACEIPARVSHPPTQFDPLPAPSHHPPQLHMPSELRVALEDEEARESIEDDCPASPPRRTSSSHSPRAVISPETGANRRYKSRRIASSSEDDDDDENADYFSDADDRHAGFAVSPSRLHTRPNGGNGPGTPAGANMLHGGQMTMTRRSSGGSHVSLVEEAARISLSRLSSRGSAGSRGSSSMSGRFSVGSPSPMSPAMPTRRRRFLS